MTPGALIVTIPAEDKIVELQYTDAPPGAANAQEFNITEYGALQTAEGHASDMVAVLLSLIPGLGHIYKGYRVIGLLLIFIGTPAWVGIAFLIATFTAGFGFFLVPLYWLGVMINVWAIPDRVLPTLSDEGEQY